MAVTPEVKQEIISYARSHRMKLADVIVEAFGALREKRAEMAGPVSAHPVTKKFRELGLTLVSAQGRRARGGHRGRLLAGGRGCSCWTGRGSYRPVLEAAVRLSLPRANNIHRAGA